METAIGIDLGNTFSAVSVVDDAGKPVIVKNALGALLTPSVIYFEDGDNFCVGEEAKEKQSFGENNVASFFKRDMGNVNFALNFHGKTFSATDLSAILLQKLKEDAEQELGKKIDKAVITVPAYFDDLQKKATIKAAEQAGLIVLRIINEPTSAAIAFGTVQTKDQTLLVYDLGGGTFDVTILKIKDGEINVLATGGDHELGGKDWDDRLISHVAGKFHEEFGADPLEDAVTFNDLMTRAEAVKKQLSAMKSARFSIVHEGNKGNYEVSREKFEEITEDLLQRTKLKAEEVLQEAETEWGKLDGVLLVGGSTRMPMVAAWVEEMSGKPPIRGINPDEAVCLGAAVQANMELAKTGVVKFALAGKIRSIKDVMSHSLGMLVENKDRTRYINSIIIPKNKTIPADEVRPYQIRTSQRNDNELELYLVQGETENLAECRVIGKYIFSGIEHVSQKIAVIDVKYIYDENGTVQVAAVQRETRKLLDKTEAEIPANMDWIYGSPADHVTAVPPLSVIIAVDLSGSMCGKPLNEAMKAANKFVEQLDLSNASIALMPFADKVDVNQRLTGNAKELQRGIAEWYRMCNTDGNCKWPVGGGNDAQPFDDALDILRKQDDPRFIIVLTDGVWSHQSKAIASAKKCKEAGIEIIAIGFGGADRDFLKKIATSDENALLTDMGGLVSSFGKIAQELTETGGSGGFRLGKGK
jgi:molecular chaperone DnaK